MQKIGEAKKYIMERTIANEKDVQHRG